VAFPGTEGTHCGACSLPASPARCALLLLPTRARKRLRAATCAASCSHERSLTLLCPLTPWQDSFYRGLTPEEHNNVSEYNFDHPNAMDQEAIMQCLLDLKARKAVEVPIYDFKTHRRAHVHACCPCACVQERCLLVLLTRVCACVSARGVA
jgi:hypothetical protein